MRWKAESEPREVRRLRYTPESGPPLVCEVVGWSADGAVPAQSVTVEDSGGGTAALVWGGDLGLRLVGCEGGERFAEPYLLVDPSDLLSG